MLSNNSSNNALGTRLSGVKIARDGTGSSERGEPQKVLGAVEATWVVVAFNDERGTPCHGLFLKVGEQYYASKDTVQWCASLLPMNEWIRKQLEQRRKQEAPVELPAQDSVDVFAP